MTDTTATVSTRRRFETLLASGDAAGARAIIAPDVLHGLAAGAAEAVTQLAGAATLAPVFEAKVVAALACAEMSEAYLALVERLAELRVRPPRRRGADPVSSGGWLPLSAIGDRLLQPLLHTSTRCLDAADRLADWPSVRALERVCVPCFRAARGPIMRLAESDAPDPDHLGTMADRDARYVTFNDTRDYNACPVDGGPDELRHALIAQIRTQRDELDAVETFARVIAADGDLSPVELHRLARIAADEARHSLLGEVALAMLGLDPFRVPVGTIGAELRRQLAPWDGLAQICLIGESGNLTAIAEAASHADRAGEPEMAEILRTIYRDELSHIARGIRLLRQRQPHASVSELQGQALARTNAFLAGRGIAPVTLAAAARAVGE